MNLVSLELQGGARQLVEVVVRSSKSRFRSPSRFFPSARKELSDGAEIFTACKPSLGAAPCEISSTWVEGFGRYRRLKLTFAIEV